MYEREFNIGVRNSRMSEEFTENNQSVFVFDFEFVLFCVISTIFRK